MKENDSHSLTWMTLKSTNIYIQLYFLTESVNMTATMNATAAVVLTNIAGLGVTWQTRVNANTQCQNVRLFMALKEWWIMGDLAFPKIILSVK